jgi:catechol 2,3-dioxygenase-like lactoylglutathione lyase family enzyme
MNPRASASEVAVDGVLEACLYADDLEAAERFYADIIGLQVHARERGRHVFFRCGAGMFLVFNPTATRKGLRIDGGEPRLRHGATGAGHVAFGVTDAAFGEWLAKLAGAGVPIEAEVTWPRGGRSIYVRDPAGNSVELATPDVWELDGTAASRGD